MKFKARFYIFLSTYTMAILGLFLLGTFAFFLLPLGGLIYLFEGGPKRA